MKSLDTLVEEVWRDTAARQNPYFVGLEREMTREDFIETQIQFFYAVVFFSRPMAALAAKIPSPELRLEVLRNVWEEHGEGQLSHGHGQTFIEFLRRLQGGTREEVLMRVQRHALWPEVRIFNTALSGVTVLDDFIIGVAVMGMIERMFSEISSWIGQGVLARGWLSEDQMIHYKLHAKLDVKHAQDFFRVVADSYAKSDENRYLIEQGLRMGATLFDGLYAGLWKSRSRRWLLPQAFPSSKTASYVP